MRQHSSQDYSPTRSLLSCAPRHRACGILRSWFDRHTTLVSQPVSMAFTPRSVDAESLNGSWIDINENVPTGSTETPLHVLVRNTGPTAHSLEKLLLDAQRECGQQPEPCPITPNGMQTPPNSVYFNNELNDRTHLSTDWLWDWSHREPLAKEWNSIAPNRKARPTVRQWIIRRGILSKEVLSVLFLTNVLSLLLGAGIGCAMILRKTL